MVAAGYVYDKMSLTAAPSTPIHEFSAGLDSAVASTGVFEAEAGVEIQVYAKLTIGASATTGDILAKVQIFDDNIAAPGYTATPIWEGTFSDQAGPCASVAAGTAGFFTAPSAGTFRLSVKYEYGQRTADVVNGNYQKSSNGTAYTRSGNWTAGSSDYGWIRAGISPTIRVGSVLGSSLSAFSVGNRVRVEQAVGRPANAADATMAMKYETLNGAGNPVLSWTADDSKAAINTWPDDGPSTITALTATDPTPFGLRLSIPNVAYGSPGQAISPLSGMRWVHFHTLPAGWSADTTLAGETKPISIKTTLTAYTLDTADPESHNLLNLQVVMGMGSPTSAGLAWTAGRPLRLWAQVLDEDTLTLQSVDTNLDGLPQAFIMLIRSTSAMTGSEYLDSDMTWKVTNGATIYQWRMTRVDATNSPKYYTLDFTGAQTENWDVLNTMVCARMVIGSTPYPDTALLDGLRGR